MTREKSSEDFVVQFSRINEFLKKIVSVTNAEGPPVPIPNTEVKLCSGENTLRETVREDSSVLTLRYPEMKISGHLKSKTKKAVEKKQNSIMIWGCSSVGRAPALQAGGHGFESHHLHQPSDFKITY